MSMDPEDVRVRAAVVGATPSTNGAVRPSTIDEEAGAPGDDAGGEAPPPLGKRFFNVRTLVSFLFGFAILAFLFTRVQIDVGAILDRVSQANPFLLVLAFLAFYATFPVRATRWRQLLRNVGFVEGNEVRLPGVAGLSEILLLSWFANCIVPAKLGDAFRAYLLKADAGVSFSRTIGTIVAERIVDLLLLFAMMVAASSLTFGQALPPEVVVLMQAGLVLAVVVVVGLVALKNIRPLVERLIPARLHSKYHHFEEGTLHSFRAIPYVVFLSLLAWAGEFARLYLVTLALGVTIKAPSVVLFVALASALATTLPLTPAGLGFAEGAIVAIFLLAASKGLAPGVDEHTAASIALLDRAISYWSLIPIGLVAYLFTKRK